MHLLYFISIIFIFVSCHASTSQNIPPANHILFSQNISTPKSEWVKNIQTTRRINGDRYADLHLDGEGNSYIASFMMHEDKRESAYLVKVDIHGKKIWEVISSGTGSARAYGMAINHRKNILWIVGFFSGEIILGDQTAFGNGHSLFIAQFDLSGNCLKVIASEGGATGFNCAIDGNGYLFVAGNCGRTLRIGDCTIDTEGETDHFLAKFSPEGDCEWIIPSKGMHTHRIAIDSNGSVYLVGTFHETFSVQETTLKTLNSYDADGLFLKFDSAGQLEWHQQIGNKGNEQYGYRANEAISFIHITANDRILVLGNILGAYEADGDIYSQKGDHFLYLAEYTPAGTRKNFTQIAKGIVERAVSTFTLDTDENIYVSSMAGESLIFDDTTILSPAPRMSFITKFNPQLSKKEWVQHAIIDSDATFRSMQASPFGLFGVGHFRDRLAFGNIEALADSVKHELFLMRLDRTLSNKNNLDIIPEEILDTMTEQDVVNTFSKDFTVSFPYLYEYGVDSEDTGILVSKDSDPLFFTWSKDNSDSLVEIQILSPLINMHPNIKVGMDLETFLRQNPTRLPELDPIDEAYEYFVVEDVYSYSIEIYTSPDHRVGEYPDGQYRANRILDKSFEIDRISISVSK